MKCAILSVFKVTRLLLMVQRGWLEDLLKIPACAGMTRRVLGRLPSLTASPKSEPWLCQGEARYKTKLTPYRGGGGKSLTGGGGLLLLLFAPLFLFLTQKWLKPLLVTAPDSRLHRPACHPCNFAVQKLLPNRLGWRLLSTRLSGSQRSWCAQRR